MLSEHYSSYSKVDTQGRSDELQIKAAFLSTDNKRSLEWWAQKNLHWKHLQSGIMRHFHSSEFLDILGECTHLKGIDGFCEVHSKKSSKEYFLFLSCVFSNLQGWGKGVESLDGRVTCASFLFPASLASLGRTDLKTVPKLEVQVIERNILSPLWQSKSLRLTSSISGESALITTLFVHTSWFTSYLKTTDHKDSKSPWQTIHCLFQIFYINPVTTMKSQWMVCDHFILERDLQGFSCLYIYFGIFFSADIILNPFIYFLSDHLFQLLLLLLYNILDFLVWERPDKETFGSQLKTSSLRSPGVVMEKQRYKKILSYRLEKFKW